eukprot:TRINITY_DN581_c2_g2_i3.p2 TRINITY_DN581_c2_g2~~TRINITY_DN581_c2_g2_i3.p2  ORF type:complete len:112 (+),score=11.55 TRINITY_DN581_c2_g2_i3:149-484(+)
MLNRGYFVLLLAAFPLVQGLLPPIDSGCAAVLCPADYDPWCCKGVEYSNSCLAQCSNGGTLDGCKPGKCPVVCPMIYDPVCCNGETFSNDCVASREFGDDVDTLCTKGGCR